MILIGLLAIPYEVIIRKHIPKFPEKHVISKSERQMITKAILPTKNQNPNFKKNVAKATSEKKKKNQNPNFKKKSDICKKKPKTKNRFFGSERHLAVYKPTRVVGFKLFILFLLICFLGFVNLYFQKTTNYRRQSQALTNLIILNKFFDLLRILYTVK